MNRKEFMAMVDETNRVAEKLITLIPDDKLDWKPYRDSLTLSELIGEFVHDAETIQGLLMVTTGEWVFDPDELESGPRTYTVKTGLAALKKDQKELRFIIEDMTKEEFHNKLVTAAWGVTGKVEKILNISLLQHKHHRIMQLFMCLKMLDVEVDTGTLYFGVDPGSIDL